MIVNLNDEKLSCTNISSQKLIKAEDYQIIMSCVRYMNERSYSALATGLVVDTKEKGSMNCKVLLHSIALKKDSTEAEIEKQIVIILRKANIEYMNTISMPILVNEPATKLERTVFFKMLYKVCATFSKEGKKSVKVVRIVSDDLETLHEAAYELAYCKKSLTNLESNNSPLNTSM